MTLAAAELRAIEPINLEYARVDGAALAALRPALGLLLGVAIGSGLCVGVCFVAATQSVAGAVLHLAIYAVTLGLAVRGGTRLALTPLHSVSRTVLDTIAGAGLVVIAVAPAFLAYAPTLAEDKAAILLLAVAFGGMAATTYRHRLLYTALATPFRDAGYRGLARTMSTLGWIKTIYEGVWLTCCTVPLLTAGHMLRIGSNFEGVVIYMAFGAFFGCFGYAAIWVTMIVVHARAATVAARFARTTA